MFCRISLDGTELEIVGARVGDSDRYTCVARNLAGETKKLYDVDVHGKFSFHNYILSFLLFST